jgi:hypothetical protein
MFKKKNSIYEDRQAEAADTNKSPCHEEQPGQSSQEMDSKTDWTYRAYIVHFLSPAWTWICYRRAKSQWIYQMNLYPESSIRSLGMTGTILMQSYKFQRPFFISSYKTLIEIVNAF